MTLSKFISGWYSVGKMLCNINAISKGKAGTRIMRIQSGKAVTRTLFSRSFWR